MLPGLKSSHKDFAWEIGKWYKHKGKVVLCESGFHASVSPIDAMGFVNCDSLTLVEVRGKSKKQDDKQVWSEMKVKKVYPWSKVNSVMLAVFSARKVLDIYEKKYPGDDRPREAIESAEEWIKNPTKENASYAASSAASYAAASYAADSYAAASAASSAASAASSAAASAASSAASAAYAAASAASYAAYAAYAASYAASYASAASYAASYASAASKRVKQDCEKYIYKLIGYKP